jgi:predicted metal-dependent phosphoesterase TrpH
MRGLLHAHSYHSFDSLLPPAAYLAYAAWHKLDFLCITDHNTLAGSLAAARLNRNPRLQVIIGAEYATDRGDLIGLFLQEDIVERRCEQVIAAIHAQGGLVVLPHPYRSHQLDDSLWSAVDVVEVFNARSSAVSNQHALAQAQSRGKPQSVGADIHTLWELARAATLMRLGGDEDLRTALVDAPRSFVTRPTSRHIPRYSQMVKRLRRRTGFPGHQ